MAKIIKVGSQNLTPHKIANPFRTSRNSTTNPFKYSNFEGNTLPFELAADVFQTKKSNKLRMIASSVTGSMNKMKSSIAEPIINFVNRINENLSNAWEYAKATSFTAAMSDAGEAIVGAANSIKETRAVKAVSGALNTVTDVLNTEIHLPEIKALSSLKEGVSSRMESMHEGAIGVGKDLRSKWDSLIAKIPSRTRYTADTPVEELEKAWLEINAMEVAV